MEQDLIFDDFLAAGNLSIISDEIKFINTKLIESGTYDPDLVLTINFIFKTLKNINIMLEDKSNISDDKKLEAVKKLITVHQSLLKHRQSIVVGDEIKEVINKLIVLYPLFLFGISFKEVQETNE